MNASTAISLLRPGITVTANQVWYDLGAGTGVFTAALAELLSDGSKIIALDLDADALKQIPERVGATRISREVADFVRYSFEGKRPHGILLANALHFVPDKPPLLRKFREVIRQDGSLLIVEYEMTKPNPWVPYPVTFAGMEKLAREAGFPDAIKLATADSRYQAGGIYSCSLKVEV